MRRAGGASRPAPADRAGSPAVAPRQRRAAGALRLPACLLDPSPPPSGGGQALPRPATGSAAAGPPAASRRSAARGGRSRAHRRALGAHRRAPPPAEARGRSAQQRPPHDPRGHALGRPDRLLLARPPGAVRPLGDRPRPLPALAQGRTLAADPRDPHPADRRSRLVSVAVVLETRPASTANDLTEGGSITAKISIAEPGPALTSWITKASVMDFFSTSDKPRKMINGRMASRLCRCAGPNIITVTITLPAVMTDNTNVRKTIAKPSLWLNQRIGWSIMIAGHLSRAEQNRGGILPPPRSRVNGGSGWSGGLSPDNTI